MPAKDFHHNIVREALENDGWKITHDPYHLSYEDVEVSIDLGAEKLLAAERGNEKIAVEIKSFLSPSIFYAFHAALGQYINYRRILEWTNKHRVLYLAIPKDTYEEFFIKPFATKLVQAEQLRIIVFDPQTKTVDKWI